MTAEDLILISFGSLAALLAGGLFVAFRRRGLHRMTGRPFVRLALGNLLVLGFLLSLVLLGGEIYYRFLYDTTDSLGQTKVTEDWILRHFVRNSSGFRDSVEYRVEPPPGLRRITFLGDSFTAGQGIADVEDRFVNRIRRMRPSWEVHGVARLGWNTAQEVKIVEELVGKGYRMDCVVLVYCLNDIGDLVPEVREAVDGIYGGEEPSFLFRHSYFLDILRNRLAAAGNPDVRGFFDLVIKGYEGPAWPKQMRRLQTLQAITRRSGARFLAVTFPYLHDGIREGDKFEGTHLLLDEFWRSRGVPHLDLREAMSAHEPGDLVVNSRDTHPNGEAHRIAADAIVAFLDRYVGW